MENSTFIPTSVPQKQTECNAKILFSELFSHKSNFECIRNKQTRQIEKIAQQKSLNPSYVTFKCDSKKSNPDNDKQNFDKLPMIRCHKKTTMVDKCFNRNDIVKDRSQLMEKISGIYLDQSCLNQSIHSTKYKKIESNTIPLQRMKKSTTKHNKTMNVIPQKSVISQNRKTLQEQMREWGLIKKKNEYEVYKLIRKNNYQRMKSNMIIAQAMKELMDKREELLGKEDSQQEIQIPLNQTDLASIKN